MPSTPLGLLNYSCPIVPAPLSGHQSQSRHTRHKQITAKYTCGLHVCHAASSVRTITLLYYKTCRLLMVLVTC